VHMLLKGTVGLQSLPFSLFLAHNVRGLLDHMFMPWCAALDRGAMVGGHSIFYWIL
jgi:hypothetical protein